VSQQPLLPGLQKLLGPPVVEIRRQTFAPAQLGVALLAAQSFEDDADLLLREIQRRVRR
jgi:hypothetical protein